MYRYSYFEWKKFVRAVTRFLIVATVRMRGAGALQSRCLKCCAIICRNITTVAFVVIVYGNYVFI